MEGEDGGRARLLVLMHSPFYNGWIFRFRFKNPRRWILMHSLSSISGALLTFIIKGIKF